MLMLMLASFSRQLASPMYDLSQVLLERFVAQLQPRC